MPTPSPKDRGAPRRIAARLIGWGRHDHFVLAALAVVVGAAAGGGAIAFRELVTMVQTLAFGFGSERVYSLAADLPWWRLMLVPAVGGLGIGLAITYLMPGRRPLGVADVVEAAALHGGRMSLSKGVGAAVVSAASIGVGASVGREGPVVHLGASLAGWLAHRVGLGRSVTRTLLGCGVAAGVAASFNAPLAGVIFALEVVIGHYAIRTFGPVVIAGVTGTVISRVYFGNFPAFVMPTHSLVSFLEFPAFAAVGVAGALLAVVFVRAVFLVQEGVARTGLPAWARPALGGLVVGAIALAFPQVLGVGYEGTDAALKDMFSLWFLVAILVAKLAATAVSLGCGFGGGVFSPSLVMGAMLGGIFGVLFTGLFPHLSSGYGAYTLVGMGAVAGAVLGAPLSTILIMFELTADYALTIAVMVGVVVASLIARNWIGPSFFTCQLERAGIPLDEGREVQILREIPVAATMRTDHAVIAATASLVEMRKRILTAPQGIAYVTDDEGRLLGVATMADLDDLAFDTSHDHLILALDVARLHPPVLAAGDSLEKALEMMRAGLGGQVAVVADRDSMRLVGALDEHEVITAYNRALLQARAEDRGDG